MMILHGLVATVIVSIEQILHHRTHHANVLKKSQKIKKGVQTMILLDKTTDATLWNNVSSLYAGNPSVKLGWEQTSMELTDSDNQGGTMVEMYDISGIVTEFVSGSIFKNKKGYFIGLAVDVTDMVTGLSDDKISFQVSGNDAVFHGDALDNGENNKRYITVLFELPYEKKYCYIKLDANGKKYEYLADVRRITFDGVAMYDGFVYDGKTYKQGEEIWNLGGWVCSETHADGKRDYTGPGSADNLPPYVPAGSTAFDPSGGAAYVKGTDDKWFAQ